VRIPLLVVPHGEARGVIEGHRRLAAAVRAGHGAVPCTLDAGKGGRVARAHRSRVRNIVSFAWRRAVIFRRAVAGWQRSGVLVSRKHDRFLDMSGWKRL
jgi:hypothetical protein